MEGRMSYLGKGCHIEDKPLKIHAKTILRLNRERGDSPRLAGATMSPRRGPEAATSGVTG